MNICRLYIQNGNNAGFWVQHRSLPNMCAQVQSIAGQRNGRLAVDPAAQSDVQVHCFDVRSGRPVPSVVSIDQPQDNAFVLIAEPAWYKGRARQDAKPIALSPTK